MAVCENVLISTNSLHTARTEGMLMNANETKCAACGGTQLQDGTLGVWKHTFMPGAKMMMFGYPVRARVCLDCGYLDHYLSRADLEEVKRKVKQGGA